MAIKSGFFNSVSGDRTYNADDMNEVAKGLVSDNGIYGSVGDKFQVVAGSGLSVNVSSGRARVKGHWVENDTAENIILEAADVTRSRYDAIVLRYSSTTRDVTLKAITGTLSATPTPPSIMRSVGTYDICLAYVLVAKGATSITQADITDTRLNSDICGYIIGLIEQIDTSQFFEQMEAWEVQKKADFDTWFSTLTSELGIITHIQELRRIYTSVANDKEITIGIANYSSDVDVLIVNLGGLLLVQGNDYTISGTGATAKIILNFTLDADNIIEFRVLKSALGVS